MLPASWARKSGATASGLREERRYSSSISRRISFASTIFTGGMQMPSSKAFSAEPQKEDGVMPPRSYWCRQLVTQQNSSPFQNTGQISITSCWCAAPTQQDVMLICPVFWKGELFCWVTNCLHQYNLGGITPSSFCGSAENAFEEGICIPPVKIVEGNEIRRDIEELYLRASRKPEAVALAFRAQLAGNLTARDRVLALIRRYGPEVVKGVMKRIIDNSEAAFLTKLKRLPDGVWRE